MPNPSGEPSAETRATRILIASGGYQVFGKERVVLELVEGLRGRGYDVHCLINAWNDGQFIRELNALDVPLTAVHLGWFYLRKPRWTLDTLVHAPRALVQCRRLFRRFRPDVVIHDNVRSLSWLGIMSQRRNVLMSHDYYSSARSRVLLRAVNGQVAIHTPVSDDVARNLVASGVDEAKVCTVENPISFRMTSAPPPRRKESEPVVGIVGQIIERKGHHILINAMRRVRELAPALPFRVKVYGQGDSEYRDRIRALADQLGVASMIEWCGYCSRRDEMYGGMDFCVVPSVDPEPFGLVAVEPAVYGKPVIASRTGGMAAIVRDGVTGYLVPPGDAVALADRIMRYLRDPSLVAAMGEAAHDDGVARFDTPIFLDKYEKIIDTVAPNRQPGN